jgi:hypothetical protein
MTKNAQVTNDLAKASVNLAKTAASLAECAARLKASGTTGVPVLSRYSNPVAALAANVARAAPPPSR